MMIYPDTTFWIALRVPHDVHHTAAKRFYGAHEDESLLWSPWHRVEVLNTIRQLARGDNPVLDRAEARHLTQRLETDVRLGYFQHIEADWRDVLRCAHEISADQAFDVACRSADLLHVAYAMELGAELFVSLDQDQVALAEAAGLAVANPAGTRRGRK
jgi:predicted nucleic acid-binding protein